jgi:hypothetical protein
MDVLATVRDRAGADQIHDAVGEHLGVYAAFVRPLSQMQQFDVSRLAPALRVSMLDIF